MPAYWSRRDLTGRCDLRQEHATIASYGGGWVCAKSDELVAARGRRSAAWRCPHIPRDARCTRDEPTRDRSRCHEVAGRTRARWAVLSATGALTQHRAGARVYRARCFRKRRETLTFEVSRKMFFENPKPIWNITMVKRAVNETFTE